jgi:hypothetical protein
MKNMNKKYLLTFSALFLLLFLIGSVSALSNAVSSNVTITTPAVSGSLGGTTAKVNCSIHAGYEAENYTRAYFYAKSSSTANSSWALIGTTLNMSNFPRDFNKSLSTLNIIEDSKDYSFNCTLWNGSTYIGATRTNILVDNTIPSAPTALSPTGTDTDGSLSFSSTIVGVNTTSCTLYFPRLNPGRASYAMTHSANACTYTLSSTPEQTYDFFVMATDGTNATNSSTSTIRVDKQSSGGKIAQLINSGQATSKGGASYAITGGINGELLGIPIWILVLTLVVGIAIYFTMRKK